MMSTDPRLRAAVKAARRLIPRRGVGSPQFGQAPLSARFALLGVLTVPLQQAGTLDIGFPLKFAEIFLGIAIIVAIVGMVRRALHGRAPRFRWAIDETCVALIALCLVLSTLIALLSVDFSTPIPGVSRSAIVDLALYAAYSIFVVAAWWTLRAVNPRLTRDVLMQSVWLCLAAVGLQAASRVTGNGREALESIGFAMDRWGTKIGDFTSLRNGPFLEGQQLGFYAGAMFIIALYSRRYASAVAAFVCVAWSLSTTAFIATVVAVIVATIFRPTRGSLIAGGGLFAAGFLLVALVAPVRDAFLLQLAKLNLFGLGNERAAVSLDVRSAKVEIGWHMMWDHPWGVGSGRFGAVFHDYDAGYPEIPKYVSEGAGRAIAENVYFQIGSELGLLAFCAFVMFIGWLVVRSWRGSRLSIAISVFAAVGATTQSSWTFIPLWVLLALCSSLILHREGGSVSQANGVRRGRRESRRSDETL